MPPHIRVPDIVRINHNVDTRDYNDFIQELRNILAHHGEYPPRQFIRDSNRNIHYVLPKQRHPGEPERWIHIKLQLDDGAETTLRVRDDNVYLIGFENKGGELFEFGFSGTMMIDGSKKKSSPMLGKSRFLECDVNYGSLVQGGAKMLVHLCLDRTGPAVRSAVRRLSGYSQGDGRRVDELTRDALAFLMVMVCEATRMRPLQMNTGWHAQCCLMHRKHVDYIWSWGDMSEALLRWKRDPDNFKFPEHLRDIGVRQASHALDIVELLLNRPIHRPPQWRGERYQRPAAGDDDWQQQRRAAGEHGSGSRGKQQSPPPPNKRRRTEQQHDQQQQQPPPRDSHLQETPRAVPAAAVRRGGACCRLRGPWPAIDGGVRRARRLPFRRNHFRVRRHARPGHLRELQQWRCSSYPWLLFELGSRRPAAAAAADWAIPSHLRVRELHH